MGRLFDMVFQEKLEKIRELERKVTDNYDIGCTCGETVSEIDILYCDSCDDVCCYNCMTECSKCENTICSRCSAGDKCWACYEEEKYLNKINEAFLVVGDGYGNKESYPIKNPELVVKLTEWSNERELPKAFEIEGLGNLKYSYRSSIPAKNGVGTDYHIYVIKEE